MFNLCVGSRSRSLTQSTMASDGWLAALEGLDGDPPLAIADGDAPLAISDGDAPLAWAAALDGLPSPSSPTSSGIDGEEGEGSALEALALQEGLPEASALHEGLPQLEAWVPFSRTWRDDALDQPAVEAAKYFTKEKVLVCSSEAQAEALGISARDVASLRTLTAAASIELERVQWQQLEAALVAAAGQVEFKAFCEFVTYDGVDLALRNSARLSVPAFPDHAVADDAGQGERHGGEAAGDDSQQLATWQLKDWSQGTTKLLNSETCVFLHVRVGQRDLLLRGDALTCLQAISRNTAACIRAAVLQLGHCTESFRNRFERRIRIAVTDAAASNLLAERAVLGERESWHGLHLLCHVHVWARIHLRVYRLCDNVTSGMVACSLSLSDSGQMSLFRASFRRVLSKELEIIREAPSGEALAYRSLVLDRFYGTSAEMAEHRLIVSRLAGGDWRLSGRFQYLALGSETREQVLDLLYTYLVPCLAGHIPEKFPRQRWTGMEESLRDFGVLAAVHNLLRSVAFDYYATNFGLASRPAGAAAAAEDLGHMAVGDVELQPQAVDGQAAADAPSDWAAVNKANRRKAMSWLNTTDPACDLVCMSIVARPLVQGMHKEIEMSSAAWATKQLEKTTAGMNDDGGVPLMTSAQWPILVAARGDLERRFFEELMATQEPKVYEGFPDAWRTSDVRHRLFKMMSRAGACVHELVRTVNKQFPYRLMLLAGQSGEEVANEIAASCGPSRDAYSASFLDKYEGQLQSQEALAELALVIMASRTSTTRLESLNATIRRHLTVMAVQAKKPSLVTVSAEFMLGKLRRRAVESVHPAGHRLHWSRRVRSRFVKRRRLATAGALSKRRGGGGAWRAFISSRCRGVTAAVFRTLAAEYRGLSREEMQQFKELGAAGTLAHRAGGGSFGLASRALAAAINRDDFLQRAQQFDELQMVPVANPSTALAIPSNDFAKKLRRCAADVLIFKKLQRHDLEKKAEAVCKWRDSAGVAHRDSAMTLLPGLGRHCANFAGGPHERGTTYLSWTSRCELEVPRFLGLRKHSPCAPVFELLAERWRRRHDIIFHDDVPAAPQEPKVSSAKKPTCLAAKLCLCGDFGDEVWRLKRWLCASLKVLLPGKLKEDLRTGNIVVCLMLPTTDEAFEDGTAGEPPHCATFLHVSLLYESPFRPTFRKLRCTKVEHGRLHLKATHQYATMLEQLQDQLSAGGLGEVKSWRVRCYRLRESRRPVVSVDPTCIEVEPIDGEQVKQLGRRRGHPAQAGGGDAGWDEELQALMNQPYMDEEPDMENAMDESEGQPELDLDSQNASGPDFSEEESSEDAASMASEGGRGDGNHGGDREGDLDGLSDQEVGRAPSGSGSSSSSASSGSSSSSSDEEMPEQRAPLAAPPPPPAPVPPAAVAPHAAAVRGHRSQVADEVLQVPGGELRFYAKTNSAVAHCSHHGLQVCRKTRTFNKSNALNRQGQGRPLGKLCAWLQCGAHPECRSAADHNQYISTVAPDFAARSAARLALKDIPGSEAFFAKEREQEGHESDEEPIEVP